MVWFKVDDGLHKHRKVRKALAEDPSSMSLWVVAGSWSSDEGTDGFISDDQLPWLIPAGAESLARILVAARLWKRVRGGYQFHEWAEDSDGTKRNPTREEVATERRKKAEAGRKGGLVSGQKRAVETIEKPSRDLPVTNKRGTKNKQATIENPSSEEEDAAEQDHEMDPAADLNSGNRSSTRQAPALAPAKQVLADSLNPRPDPTRPKGRGSSKPSTHVAHDPGPQPPPRCQQHIDDPDPPNCGRCADARKARNRWDIDNARQQHDAPKCTTHRGQPADNCALCRAEQLGAH